MSYTKDVYQGYSWYITVLFFYLFTYSTNLNAQQPPSGTDNGSEFTSRLINIESPVNKPFRYNATLSNGSSKPQVYDLTAELPKGWRINFKAHGKSVTSIKVEGQEKENITVELYAMYDSKPDEYDVQLTALSEGETLNLDLEAVVEGSYEISLSTPSGRLSDQIIEGNQKEIQLVVKNTATLTLEDIKISAQTPPKWEATFEPNEIKELSPGSSKNITVTLKVPDKTIVGDYVTKFKAKGTNVEDEAVFRMTVVTSWITGWAGVLVILITIALVYYLVRKYGRR